MSRVISILFLFVLTLSASTVANLKGELSVNSGVLNYSIPLNLPAGTAGVKPKLSLEYSSNGANGYYGIGWSLSNGASIITRCGSNLALDGKVRGVKYDDKDNLCMDGQRLVLESGSAFSYGAVYKTKIDSYSKITYFDDKIEVRTKSGDIKEFTKFEGSDVWLLTKISDRFSNSIVYNYEGNNEERYLKSITYSDNKIVLNYEDKKDKFFGYSHGHRIKLTKRVKSIDIKSGDKLLRTYKLTYKAQNSALEKSFLQSFTECSGGECLEPVVFENINKYGLNHKVYEADFSRYIIKMLANNNYFVEANENNPYFRSDRELRIITDIGYREKSLIAFFVDGVWTEHINSMGYENSGVPIRRLTEFDYNHGWRVDKDIRTVVDIDGDGLADIVGIKNDAIYISLQYRDEGGHYRRWKDPKKISLQNNTKNNRHLADMNKDGLLDIVSFESDGVYVYYNQGDLSFSQRKLISSNSDWFSDDKNKQFLFDINADGLVDIVSIMNNGSINIAYNEDGKNFTLQRNVISANITNDDFKNTNVGFSDVNGDGFIDITSFTSQGVYVALNRGNNSFDSFIKVTTNFSGSGWEHDKSQKQFIDLNRDGLADIAGFGRDGVYVSYGLGDLKFDSPKKLSDEFSYNKGWRNNSQFLREFVDLDSDGNLDIIGFDKHRTIALYNKQELNKIGEIKDSFNNHTYINYEKLNTGGYKNQTYPTPYFSSPIYVVSSVYSYSSNYQHNTATNYTYEGLKYNVQGLGSLGFKKITVTNQLNNSKTVTTYRQDYPYVGMIDSIKSYLGDELLSESKNEYSKKQNNSILQIFNTKTTTKTYQDGVLLLTKVESKSNFDNYGNPKRVETTITDETTGEVFKKTLQNQYQNYPDKWILARLTKSTLTSEAYGDRKTKTSNFTYDSDTGILTSESIEGKLTKRYEYDDKGNKIKETILADDIEDRVTTFGYDELGKFVTKITNPKNQTINKKYDADGNLLSITDPNGLKTTFRYDNFGKKIEQTRADGVKTRYSYNFDNTKNGSYYSITVQTDGLKPLTTYYNSIDQKVAIKTKDFKSNDIYQEFYYNDFGNLTKESTPHKEDETPSYKKYSYDKYQRVINITQPSPKGGEQTSTIEYDGYKTTYTDAKGLTKTIIKNALGKKVEVDDEMGAVEKYKYDALGNLIKTIDSDGNIITLKYDNFLGKKSFQNDPDMGSWSYEYYPTGELKSQTDAKGQVTTFEYDKLGRKTKEKRKDVTINYIYDTKFIGKLSLESQSDGYSKEYFYDKLGRVIKTTVTIGDKTLSTTYSYDNHSRLTQKTLPNNFKEIYTYNSYGELVSIKSPKEQIKDFDEEHFKNLIDKTLNRQVEYQKKANEYLLKAKQLRAKAKRYKRIADIYKYRGNRWILDYLRRSAKTLDKYADIFEYRANYYQRWSDYYKQRSNYYLKRASHSWWWGRWYYRWLANRYAYYARILENIAYNNLIVAQTARENIEERSEIDLLHSSYQDIINTYIKKAKETVKEAEVAVQKANYYKHLANSAKILTEDRQMASEYQEIAQDSKYNYFYKVLEKDSLGRVVKYISGNGLVTTTKYDESGVLTHSKTGYTFDNPIREYSYEYDEDGNLVTLSNDKLKVSSTYEYDNLNRVVRANVYLYNKEIDMSYNYDRLGNITYKSDIGDYEYDPTHPHQVIRAGNKTFKYDANGNMIDDDGQKLSYTSNNLLKSIQTKNNFIEFSYGSDNQRYKKETNTYTSYYLGKSYELKEYSDNNKEDIYYIYADGKVVSIYAEKREDNILTPSTKYLHYDSLGSVDTITNNQGVVEARFAYMPFGKKINLDKDGNEIKETLYTNRGYTGHEHIQETKNLIHMNGRVYDSSIARFTSADPYIQAPDNTQSFNRYSYVMNNPLKYVDPSGYFFSGLRHAFHKAVHRISHAFKKAVNWVSDHAKEIATAAIIVASGGLGLAAVSAMGASGIAAAAIGGAVAGFASGVGITLLNGGSLSQAFRNGAKGAIFGAISGAAAFGVGHMIFNSNVGSLLNPGSGGYGAAFEKAVMHGIVRAGMAKLQGQKVSAGFWSGFVASGFAAPKSFGIEKGTFVNAVVGGTTSELTGGKFANGAVTSSFIHLFNAWFWEIMQPVQMGDGTLKLDKNNNIVKQKVKIHGHLEEPNRLTVDMHKNFELKQKIPAKRPGKINTFIEIVERIISAFHQ